MFPPRAAVLLFLPLMASVLSAAEPSGSGNAVFHAAPKPVAEGVRQEEWPRFLGERDAPVSGETGIARDWPETGPPVVWEFPKGSGYASPAIAGGKLVLFHRVAGNETVDCLEPETGRRLWTCSYPVPYRDDFGYSDGPRAGPVIEGDRIFIFGVTGWLKCLDLADGKVVWEVDCQTRYEVPKYFFGTGSSPLVRGGLLLVNVGGGDGQCVVAFDKATGAEKWIAKHEWGQSYASPVSAKWHGQDRVMFFTGGKSDPATGGLLVVDPVKGEIESSFPWRARRYPSVNASSPVLCGDNQVFVSQAYVDRSHPHNGGVMLRCDESGKLSEVWRHPDFGCHWMTPVYHEGHLYAFSGEKERQCELVCHETATGRRLWREKMEWEYHSPEGRTIPMGLYRASLLKVGDRFLCLGEWGTLCWLDLTPQGARRSSTVQLFTAQQSWTLPALSHGLLYVSQNEDDRLTNKPARLLCYDLRAGGSALKPAPAEPAGPVK
ncbi:MAG: PQQ-binding-like beta-propeller repeat protein [Verrucomicrobiota bacterium]